MRATYVKMCPCSNRLRIWPFAFSALLNSSVDELGVESVSLPVSKLEEELLLLEHEDEEEREEWVRVSAEDTDLLLSPLLE